MRKTKIWVLNLVWLIVVFPTSAMASTGNVVEVHDVSCRTSESRGIYDFRCYDYIIEVPGGEEVQSRGSGGGGGGVGSVADAGKSQKQIADTAESKKPSTCNPVVLSTGEKYKTELDFGSGSDYGLTLQRTYRSAQATGTLFGNNWPSTLEGPRLRVSGPCQGFTEDGVCVQSTATVFFSDGTKVVYTSKGLLNSEGMYSYSAKGAAATGELMYDGYWWSLVVGNVTYSFYQNGSISTISDQAGATIGYVYDNRGFLSRIYDPVGRFVELTFGYNNMVNKIKDSAGNDWQYAYNANGMLTQVTSPGASPNVRTYHY